MAYVVNDHDLIYYVKEMIGEYDLPWNMSRQVERVLVRGFRARMECLEAVPGETDPQKQGPAYRFVLSVAARKDTATALRTVQRIARVLRDNTDADVTKEASAWLKALPKMNDATLRKSLAQWRSRRYRQGRRAAETKTRCAATCATYDGFVFERVVSVKAARAAGRALGNCVGAPGVGTYYLAALREGSLALWTVRQADEVGPAGLVAVNLRDGCVKEAKGRDNETLPLAMATAFRLFCRDHANPAGGVADLGCYRGFVTADQVVAARGELGGKPYEVATAGTTVRITLGAGDDVAFGYLDAGKGLRYERADGRGLKAAQAMLILVDALARASGGSTVARKLAAAARTPDPRPTVRRRFLPLPRIVDDEEEQH
ncbi:PcfJ domain-containing protein [Acidisphaera rubrifaciens]|uniref:Uncharacterized protein n=1 Tax=Acidisphaera rubrifaciens HS-AP3 TaxID=1231350 RepID=A0A0D6P5H5_9PROT|nr:PcfJ domain-containing protein [Acidisphaera rubrifaciens]GAN76109.1 hypothetical protein Asru_0053_04 [Acidisphaera rubrifaciens HS-AP3]